MDLKPRDDRSQYEKGFEQGITATTKEFQKRHPWDMTSESTLSAIYHYKASPLDIFGQNLSKFTTRSRRGRFHSSAVKMNISGEAQKRSKPQATLHPLTVDLAPVRVKADGMVELKQKGVEVRGRVEEKDRDG
ncbi:hypothetical protein RRG08_013198 [Elysia crispata]|uniref:Uncharacterized protein n=1 Tax=Elysia crispata TaxID=231223 RepID=A0AAE1EB00_9GAST|nr:hypothetical protein RRG08_013198 [Elysia crispata]